MEALLWMPSSRAASRIRAMQTGLLIGRLAYYVITKHQAAKGRRGGLRRVGRLYQHLP